MRKFLIIATISALAIFIPLGIFLSMANGNTDAYYLRFTTPIQKSMIIGTSRSAQGLNPDILNDRLHRNDLFNYSFTQTHSPFGPIYLQSIQKKLDINTQDGVFIVSVEPWALGEFNQRPNDSTKFREVNSILDKTFWVNLNPNIPYLLKNYNKHFINLYSESKHPSNMQLHKNGWLEIQVNLSNDSIQARTIRKNRDYKEVKAPTFHISELRIKYLEKTIQFLQKHGRVYLVRLPVGEQILQVEHQIFRDFNTRMHALENKYHVPYFDFTPKYKEYIYVDGNHISAKSIPTISSQLADSILTNE
jgi:hypothetical protein